MIKTRNDEFAKEAILNVFKTHHYPLTSKELQYLTGYSDVYLRSMIRELRIDGEKVCSGTEGFWLWNGVDDSWNHTKNQIRSRFIALQELYYAMENLPLDGQEEMEV